MANPTGIIVNNGNYTNTDLNVIFQPKGSATQSQLLDYQSKGVDLSQIFLYYTSGIKALATNYTVNVVDLKDIFARFNPVPSFTFTQGTQPTIETLTVSGYTYYMMKFTTSSANTTYQFYPNSDIYVYQLFVVSGGNNGIAGDAGGKGGHVTGYNNNSLTAYTRVSKGPSNSFTLTVGAGNQESNSVFVGTTTPSTNLNYVANPINGSSGVGITNIFTNFVYGGAGGSNATNIPGSIGLPGYSGGGGAGGNRWNYNTVVASGGSVGDGVNKGGNGGRGGGGLGRTGEPGQPGTGVGGGGGGAPTTGGGGGGGAGGFGGGGGGGGGGSTGNPAAGGGGGGSGVIILIFTT